MSSQYNYETQAKYFTLLYLSSTGHAIYLLTSVESAPYVNLMKSQKCSKGSLCVGLLGVLLGTDVSWAKERINTG